MLKALWQPEFPTALTINEKVPLHIRHSSALEPSVNIFPPNTPFTWSMTLELDGLFVPFVALAADLTFTAQADMLVGGGPTVYPCGAKTIPAGSVTPTTPTKGFFKVEGLCPGIPEVGTYMMTVALTTKLGSAPTFIAGFDQILIQVADGV
ncbi:MAG: hypothetical protein ABSF50_19640 [Burkholderiaceae bacterium]|jgi:hypothetical protein